jgi:hypothetical protein
MGPSSEVCPAQLQDFTQSASDSYNKTRQSANRKLRQSVLIVYIQQRLFSIQQPFAVSR